MEASDVLDLLSTLDDQDVYYYWLDGGWGVDCLLGEQSREHSDLDLVIPRVELERVRGLLASRGYSVIRDWLPMTLAFRADRGREVDLHPVDMTGGGGGTQVLLDGKTWHYAPPVEGSIEGRTIRCATAEDQLLMHQGYEPRPVDFADVCRIAERFGLRLPAPFNAQDRRWSVCEPLPRRLRDRMRPEVEEKEIVGGWDSRASIVDGVWLNREPLRSEIRPKLLTETRLLRWLAPQLPLPVPLPQVAQDEPLRVRHRLIPGTPATHLTGDQGAALGGFFRTLHSVDTTAAAATGVPTHDAAWDEHLQHLDRFRREVLPRVPEPRRGLAESLLERLSQPPPAPVLVHGDVGPGHILLADGTVSGVIDWSDAHIGDPALDLAWLIHGSSAGESVATEYEADAALVQRAHDWHLLGPWHEVLYGLDIGGPAYVKSGMIGVLSRIS